MPHSTVDSTPHWATFMCGFKSQSYLGLWDVFFFLLIISFPTLQPYVSDMTIGVKTKPNSHSLTHLFTDVPIDSGVLVYVHVHGRRECYRSAHMGGQPIRV